nr:hypothetical protein [Marinicella sp. W31]MDC2875754.1 hypothetical protein [Marinicella sp. W31]
MRERAPIMPEPINAILLRAMNVSSENSFLDDGQNRAHDDVGISAIAVFFNRFF